MPNQPGAVGPIDKEIQDLANALVRARDTEESGGRGRAVFLIGAGCSVTAGIPDAAGVARHCAIKLAKCYSEGNFQTDDADAALEWLRTKKHLSLSNAQLPASDQSHWDHLYYYFFEQHLMSPNEQREVINELIDKAGDHINWAHACLGELVFRRYAHTVLTTNFDQLVLQGIVRTGYWPVIADGLESVNRIVGSPKRPQVVHLHGSMHTYNLRNSKISISATEDDKGAVSMIHNILQQSNLLVVVGYGGGENGIMRLLQDAATDMSQLVIFWVSYEPGREGLSGHARQLLAGENKFLVWGGDADKFFGDLISELGIGQPDWVGDPIEALKLQSEKLVAPTDNELDAIGILIRAFQERVGFAVGNRWSADNEDRVKAAENRARGRFEASQTKLKKFDLSKDPEAKRLHALNLRSLFERDGRKSAIEEAIQEFSELLDATSGTAHVANLLSLIDTLFDLSDVESADENADNAALSRIVELTKKWQADNPKQRNQLHWSQLTLRRAQAKQVLGEGEPEDLPILRESESDYDEAIAGLVQAEAREAEIVDANAGLAAVLQVLGRAGDGNEAQLRKSVRLFREVVEQSRRNTGRREDAGPLKNLSGALIALSEVVTDPEETTMLLHEARSALETAERIYGSNTELAGQ
jgi:SIR2-like domain